MQSFDVDAVWVKDPRHKMEDLQQVLGVKTVTLDPDSGGYILRGLYFSAQQTAAQSLKTGASRAEFCMTLPRDGPSSERASLPRHHADFLVGVSKTVEFERCGAVAGRLDAGERLRVPLVSYTNLSVNGVPPEGITLRLCLCAGCGVDNASTFVDSLGNLFVAREGCITPAWDSGKEFAPIPKGDSRSFARDRARLEFPEITAPTLIQDQICAGCSYDGDAYILHGLKVSPAVLTLFAQAVEYCVHLDRDHPAHDWATVPRVADFLVEIAGDVRLEGGNAEDLGRYATGRVLQVPLATRQPLRLKGVPLNGVDLRLRQVRNFDASRCKLCFADSDGRFFIYSFGEITRAEK